MIRNSKCTAVATVGLLVLAACAANKEKQLESVAKDWFLTIRASQVMPVYPLTEDLQPGDIFLVQLPIDEQQKQWKQKGLLPLDNHIARLDPDKYLDFYNHSFLPGTQKGSDPLLPASWRAARPGVKPDDPKVPAWDSAPRAGFPTYSFSVRKSGGLDLAIPVSGVPVGLGVMGSDAADGTVSIKNARTLGIDQASLYRMVQKWAKDERDYLATYAPHTGRQNYLRIVNRIYLTGGVDISLRDASSRAAGLDVGQPKSVATQMVETPTGTSDTPQTATANYNAALKSLNDSLAPAAQGQAGGATSVVPGGSVRFTSVSTRAVSMSETFDPPLVIGYLGFDVAIGEFGEIGPPVPTFAVMEYGLAPQAAASSELGLVSNARMQIVALALKEMGEAGDSRAKELRAELNELGSLLPEKWPCSVYDGEGKVLHAEGTALRRNPADYESVSVFRGALITSIGNLEEGLTSPEFKLADQPQGTDAKTFIETRLAACKTQLDQLTKLLEPHAGLFAEADRHSAPYQPKH